MSKFDRILAKKSFAIVQTAMPAQLMASHACLGHALPAIRLVAPISKQLAGRHIRLHSVMHVGTDQDMLESMAEYGLEKQNLSHVIGGGFSLGNLLSWIEKQEQKERERIYATN